MATTAERLDAAKDAYDKLVMGDKVRELRDQNGEEIRFARADLPKLAALIRQLEQEVATAPSGPLRVYF